MGLGASIHAPTPAFADGPAPCSVGGPPDPFHGFCGTFGGRNTFYGSYGPGFPTALGWGFCAENAATGGLYPDPSYDYVPSGAPAGADTADLDPLGYALSQAQANGWWTFGTGTATANAFAAAGKILYDNVVWGQGIPSMSPEVLAAFDDLDGWYAQAAGATGTPTMGLGIAGGGTTMSGSAFLEVHVQFPGSGSGVVGLGLLMSISGGAFNSPTGPTTIGLSTDSSGDAVVPIFAPGSSVTVTVDSAAGVGNVGVDFYQSGNAAAQDLVSAPSPTALEASLALSNSPQTPIDGTLSVQKAVDDGAYYGPGGAVFDITSNGALVTTLTTDSSGATPLTPPLAPGTYQVSEVTPPPYYQAGSTQTVTVIGGQNTVVSFTGPLVNHIRPATVTIAKRDGHTGAPLDGAVFDVRYDSTDNGTYSQDLGECTTSGPTGTCSPPGNDGTALLPGGYQITEVQAPPGYTLDTTSDTQTVYLSPGENGEVTFFDYQGGLTIVKSGNDTAYASITGAVFTVTGPLPSTSAVGTLTVGTPSGTTGELYPLVAGQYVLTETTVPAGYSAVAPITVSVAAGIPSPTVVDVLDRIQPATVSIVKVDAESGKPLAGAVFEVAYAPVPGGPYSQSLGTCTTSESGSCEPNGNDGVAALLPGDYQVTEITPPPGYLLPPDPVRDLTLAPSETGAVTFADQPLVPVRFQKVATGNYNPSQVTYAGAVIDVTPKTPSGAVTATCTTDSSGACAIPAVLDGGREYCWTEVTAPAGLLAGANGCFTASESQAALPITVSDPGSFVAVAVRKVDASNPSVTLPGAVFDLYRMDGGTGPDRPAPPAGATPIPGGTWVARSTTGAGGIASFPLQFPGYAYCAVERTPPPNYVGSSGTHCSAVLTGSAVTPATINFITVADAEAAVTLQVFKYNSLTPDTGIPGATYDLYVEGGAPPGGVPSKMPVPAPSSEPGDTWYARGTTGPAGTLDFTVPAGYAWCLHEVAAPVDYELDSALHCTAVLTTSSPPVQTTVALPETLATVHIAAQKYNSEQPNTVIPGATYELLVRGTAPPGYTRPSAPSGAAVPTGDEYWGDGTSNAQGQLDFAVPAGYAWCLHELRAPTGYAPDPSFHCTAVLTNDTPALAMTIALPEQPDVPLAAVLAFTGGPGAGIVGVGVILVVSGAMLWFLGRRRRSGKDAGPGPPEPDDSPPGGGSSGGGSSGGGSSGGGSSGGGSSGGGSGSGDPRSPSQFQPALSSQGRQRHARPRHERTISMVLVVSSVVLLSTAAATLPAAAAAAPAAAVPRKPAAQPAARPAALTPGTIAERDASAYELTDVTCPTTARCIAVGFAGTPTGQTSSAVALYSTTGGKRFVPATSVPQYTPFTRIDSAALPVGTPTCGPSAEAAYAWTRSGCWGMVRVVCPTAAECFAMGGWDKTAYLWRSTDGGRIWEDLSSLLPANGTFATLYDLSCTDASSGNCVLVGYDPEAVAAPSGPVIVDTSGLYTTAPSFIDRPVPANIAGLSGVACTSATHCVAVGIGSYPCPTGAVTCTPGSLVYGAASLTSTDAGTTWTTSLNTPVQAVTTSTAGHNHPGLNALSCPSQTACIAAGGNPVAGLSPDLAMSTDGGASWHVVQESDPQIYPTATLYGISCATDSDCIAVGNMSHSGNPAIEVTGISPSSPSPGTILVKTGVRTIFAETTHPSTTTAYGVAAAQGLVVGGNSGSDDFAFVGLGVTAELESSSLPGLVETGGVTCPGVRCVGSFGSFAPLGLYLPKPGAQFTSYSDTTGFTTTPAAPGSTAGRTPVCIQGTTTCVSGDVMTTNGASWSGQLTFAAVRHAKSTSYRTTVIEWTTCTTLACYGTEVGGGVTGTPVFRWAPGEAGPTVIGTLPGSARARYDRSGVHHTDNPVLACTTVGTADTCLLDTAFSGPIEQARMTAPLTWKIVSTLVPNDLSCAPTGGFCLVIGTTGSSETAATTTLTSAVTSTWHATAAPPAPPSTDVTVTNLACTAAGQCGIGIGAVLGDAHFSPSIVDGQSARYSPGPTYPTATGEIPDYWDVTDIVSTSDAGASWTTAPLPTQLTGTTLVLSCSPDSRARFTASCDMSVATAIPTGFEDVPTTITGSADAAIVEGLSLPGTATSRTCRGIATVTATPPALTLIPESTGGVRATVYCTGSPAGPTQNVTWSSAEQSTATVAPLTGVTGTASIMPATVTANAVGTTTVRACIGSANPTKQTSYVEKECAPVTVNVVAAAGTCPDLRWSITGTGQETKVTSRFPSPLGVVLDCRTATRTSPIPGARVTWTVGAALSGASGTFSSLGGATTSTAISDPTGRAVTPPVFANASADAPAETWPVAVTAVIGTSTVPLGTYALVNTTTAPTGLSCPSSATPPAPGWVLSGAGAPQVVASGAVFAPLSETVDCRHVTAGTTTVVTTPTPTASVVFTAPVAPPTGTWHTAPMPAAGEVTTTGTFAGVQVADVATSPAATASLNATGNVQDFTDTSPTTAPPAMGALALGSLAYPLAITPTVVGCATPAITVTPGTVTIAVGGTAPDTATLTCSGQKAPPGIPVSWVSAAPGTATVTPSLEPTTTAGTAPATITGKAPGTTTAVACVEGTNTCAPVTVNVVAAAPPPPPPTCTTGCGTHAPPGTPPPTCTTGCETHTPPGTPGCTLAACGTPTRTPLHPGGGGSGGGGSGGGGSGGGGAGGGGAGGGGAGGGGAGGGGSGGGGAGGGGAGGGGSGRTRHRSPSSTVHNVGIAVPAVHQDGGSSSLLVGLLGGNGKSIAWTPPSCANPWSWDALANNAEARILALLALVLSALWAETERRRAKRTTWLTRSRGIGPGA